MMPQERLTGKLSSLSSLRQFETVAPFCRAPCLVPGWLWHPSSVWSMMMLPADQAVRASGGEVPHMEDSKGSVEMLTDLLEMHYLMKR